MGKNTSKKGRVIGLTGNMASGKSTVARLLSELGVPVIDADQVAREVTGPGTPALKQITAEFGQNLVDDSGHLDRAALRAIAFKGELSRKKLEAILHPAIGARSRELFEEHLARGAKLVVYEASLLVETGRHTDFDGLLVVTTKPELQAARALARDATLSAEIAAKMISAQLSQEEKARHATWVIKNEGTLEELRAQVKEWLEHRVNEVKI